MNYPLTNREKAALFDKLIDRAWRRYLEEQPYRLMGLTDEEVQKVRKVLEPLLLALVPALTNKQEKEIPFEEVDLIQPTEQPRSDGNPYIIKKPMSRMIRTR
jgi:hypothetical protein